MTSKELEQIREKEKTFLFYKTMQCPVCEKPVKFRTIKSGKLKIESTDDDMRPHYYGVDANKYHVVACNNCGFTALQRYFEPLPGRQIKLIQEKICADFKPNAGDPEYISYREAFERYHKAINSAIAKGAKTSELAYLYLKTAWILRGEAEEFVTFGQQAKADSLADLEKKFLKAAYDGFMKAMMEEDYPMCGMDEVTVDYLVAALAIGQGDNQTGLKLLSTVVTSFAANARMKDKARELKEKIEK